ncbi:MAG: rod shape-determining protein MreC [Chlorobi bacterium]|nr:rod shape-determining protein MreC [Chlorobiota bacterium]
MRRLLAFIKKHNYLITFLIIELIAFAFSTSLNAVHKSAWFNTRVQLVAFLNQWSSSVREYINLTHTLDQMHYMTASALNKTTEYIERRHISGVFIPAHVVSMELMGRQKYIIINRGEVDGVKKFAGVVAPVGIVGVVSAVSENYSLVKPIISRDIRVSVLINRNYWATMIWEPPDPQVAFLIDVPVYLPVKEGDSVFTSGAAGIFPPMWTVGEVIELTEEEVGFIKAKVKLFTSWRRLTRVFIFNSQDKEEWDSLRQKLLM